ncbi:MAG: tRNA preQ1(34) S-adenosylmethionine ribosyltransferase-isomerase QueA [Pseudomonadota bacterium]|nr:tRNA preQ1(34) S-adenosylmethionine ribosyltransferase-isomerase QueA [Pseudomonadota bacterium]
MNLDDFHYELPQELIATVPLSKRNSSRLLQLNKKTKSIIHGHFKDLVSLLNNGDMLVLNNTKVLPARLYTKKNTGGNVTLLIEEIINDNSALVMAKANSKLKIPTELNIIGTEIKLQLTRKEDDRFIITSTKPIIEILMSHGHMPLPPYLNRVDTEEDINRYQTVYAKKPGAIAAPTAGLHFDNEILEIIKAKGVNIAYITLHVGSGTFQSVRTQDITQHTMHSEHIEVPENVANLWYETKKRGARVIAVGTTAVRSLESAWDGKRVVATTGKTNLFITPGYKFNTIDALVTNFHLPKSTLLMLVCALGGYDFMMQAYKTSVTEKYRFFSYGDAMFIE